MSNQEWTNQRLIDFDWFLVF